MLPPREYAVTMNSPSIQMLLVEDFAPKRASDQSIVLDELRARLEKITGVSTVEVAARGRSTAVATLPARNARERDRLKNLLTQHLEGWKVVEAQQYSLPQTF